MCAEERRRREGYDALFERGWTIACVAYPWLGTRSPAVSAVSWLRRPFSSASETGIVRRWRLLTTSGAVLAGDGIGVHPSHPSWCLLALGPSVVPEVECHARTEHSF